MLSKFTGIGISPHGIKIDPKKAIMTALTVGSMGGFGPLAGVANAIPGAGAIASGLGKAKGALSMIPGAARVGEMAADHGGFGGMAHSAMDFAKGHGSELLAGAQVLNAANLGRKSNRYADNAMDSVNHSYMDRAGLRSSGIDELMHPQTPDVTQLQRIRSSNPYAGPLPMARVA